MHKGEEPDDVRNKIRTSLAGGKMGYRIALLLKEHYRKWMPEWEAAMSPDTKLVFIPYETLKELAQIYQRERSCFDGFYVSGIIPYSALCTLDQERDGAVIGYTSIDMANTYRILLQKFVESKLENISRVGLDFMSAEENLEEIIKADKLHDAIRSYEKKWKDIENIEGLEEEENRVNLMYTKHCLNHDFDLVVTYFQSVVENMAKYGVECFYVYPSTESFCQTIDNMKKSISLNAMKGKMNGAVYIETGKSPAGGQEDFDRKKKIREAVEDFNRENLNKMILKDNGTDIELFSDYDLLREVTDGFKYCPLLERIKKAAGGSGNIGYGVGDSIYQARINAIDASRYGRNMNQSEERSFFIDENENIVILKNHEFQSAVKVSESYINRVANKAKLSAETVLKIVKVMQARGSNQITSQDLMETLQISLRTANKFLSVLERSGYAYVCDQKRNGNKGRPVNVYKVNINY